MKSGFLLIVIFLLPLISFSQLEDAALDSLKKIWKKELKAEMVEMQIGVYDPEESLFVEGTFTDSVRLAFEKDTFLINGIYSRQLDADQTTFGMNRATYDYETELDVLLNKYYTLLLKKMTKEDRELLRESQRNWIKFRDSERKLSAQLTMDNYSGGGTIQTMIHSSRVAEITEDRLFEIVNYLQRLWGI